jgi:hypothetical protein
MPNRVRSASLTDYSKSTRSVGLEPSTDAGQRRLIQTLFARPRFQTSGRCGARAIGSVGSSSGDRRFRLAAGRETLANLGPLWLFVRDQPTVRQGIEAWIQIERCTPTPVAANRRARRQGGHMPSAVCRKAAPTNQVVLDDDRHGRTMRSFLGDRWKAASLLCSQRATQLRYLSASVRRMCRVQPRVQRNSLPFE